MSACRVYVGSFNGGKSIRTDVNPNCKDLFRKEQDDLLQVCHFQSIALSAFAFEHSHAHHRCVRVCSSTRQAHATVTMSVQELTTLPGKSCDRKVSEVVKRVRALKVHLLLLQHLKKKMPTVLGKSKAQTKILDNLPDHFHTVRVSRLLCSSRAYALFEAHVAMRRVAAVMLWSLRTWLAFLMACAPLVTSARSIS